MEKTLAARAFSQDVTIHNLAATVAELRDENTTHREEIASLRNELSTMNKRSQEATIHNLAATVVELRDENTTQREEIASLRNALCIINTRVTRQLDATHATVTTLEVDASQTNQRLAACVGRLQALPLAVVHATPVRNVRSGNKFILQLRNVLYAEQIVTAKNGDLTFSGAGSYAIHAVMRDAWGQIGAVALHVYINGTVIETGKYNGHHVDKSAASVSLVVQAAARDTLSFFYVGSNEAIAAHSHVVVLRFSTEI